MNTLDVDNELNAMIIDGKSVDAFNKFHDKDVVAQENDEPARVGRDEWMRARMEMEKKTKKFHARVSRTPQMTTPPFPSGTTTSSSRVWDR